MSFTSNVFETRTVTMADREETIVAGGRNLFPLLPKAFDGIKQMALSAGRRKDRHRRRTYVNRLKVRTSG